MRNLIERFKRAGLHLKLSIIEHQVFGKPLTMVGEMTVDSERFEVTIRIVRIPVTRKTELRPVK